MKASLYGALSAAAIAIALPTWAADAARTEAGTVPPGTETQRNDVPMPEAAAKEIPAASDTGAPLPSGAPPSGQVGEARSPAVSPLTSNTLGGSDQAAEIRPAGEVPPINAGGLLAAIANLDVEMLDLRALQDVPQDSIAVVSADQALAGVDADVIKDEIAENKQDIEALRSYLEDSGAFAGALRRQQASTSDVIAADVLDDGKVVLYTRQD